MRVVLVAEVEPRLRVLVREQRVVSADVFVVLKLDNRARKVIPGFRWDWMGWRPDGQQINHHQLAVVAPARCAEA